MTRHGNSCARLPFDCPIPECLKLPVKRSRTAGPAMKLAGPLAGGSPGLRLGLRFVLALEIERHGSADEILQGRLINLVAFMDVDGAPDIPVEAGVEETGRVLQRR